MTLLLSVLAALAFGPAAPPDGRDLIRQMHDRYAGKWYGTLSFVQHNTAWGATDTTPPQHSVWFERAAIPGRLRIDFREGGNAPPGSGLLFVRDSQFFFAGDSLRRATAFVHPLMVLGFDVYAQPVERTLAQLQQVGYDMTTVHDDVWQGRPVWVVGARAGDLHTRQFWVDQERLLFVRSLEPAGNDSTKTEETQFNQYVRHGGGWVAEAVLFIIDGRKRWLEEYQDVQTDGAVPEGAFDPRQWAAMR